MSFVIAGPSALMRRGRSWRSRARRALRRACTAISRPRWRVALAVELDCASVDHCTYFDDADIDLLAARPTVATLLPGRSSPPVRPTLRRGDCSTRTYRRPRDGLQPGLVLRDEHGVRHRSRGARNDDDRRRGAVGRRPRVERSPCGETRSDTWGWARAPTSPYWRPPRGTSRRIDPGRILSPPPIGPPLRTPRTRGPCHRVGESLFFVDVNSNRSPESPWGS